MPPSFPGSKPQGHERRRRRGRASLPCRGACSDGARLGAEAATRLGLCRVGAAACRRSAAKSSRSPAPLWWVHGGKGAAFVDLQNDVTTKDIELAKREGYGAVRAREALHHARHGHRPGQDRQCRRRLAFSSELTGAPIPELGTTGFRPPYTPVTWGALAGHHRGKDFRPRRLPPSHAWASENGAVFADAGLWLRAQWYRAPGRDTCSKASRARRRRCGARSACAMCRRSARSTFRGRTRRPSSTASISTNSPR